MNPFGDHLLNVIAYLPLAGALVILLAMMVAVSGCASKFRSYNGPEVTQIYVMKAERRMYLMHDTKVLRSFDVDLGFAPEGDKQIEGDGKTPEGRLAEMDQRGAAAEHDAAGEELATGELHEVSSPFAAPISAAKAPTPTTRVT